MKQTIPIISTVILIVSLVFVGFTFWQVNEERSALETDLQIRTVLLADGLKEAIRPAYLSQATSTIQTVLDKFAGRERLLGLAVYDNKGSLLATSAALMLGLVDDSSLPEKAMDRDTVESDFIDLADSQIFSLATPLRADDNVVGALVVFQRADYIDAEIAKIWKTNLMRFFLQIMLLSIAIVLLVHWVIYRPILMIAEKVRQIRSGNFQSELEPEKGYGFLRPIMNEMNKMSRSLVMARLSASEEARMRLEKLDTPWTAERLSEFFKAYARGRQIFVVSNREPYSHVRDKAGIRWEMPASGMVTALEPVMEACGGLWLAHGSGNADRESVDEHDKVAVPPEEPRYTLKRIWLNDEEVAGYYKSYSNEALLPLCLFAHIRPQFSQRDWQTYRAVNGKFAQALLAEIRHVERPIVLIQDYHFSLLPEMIKKARPDAEIGIFWHIPWPNAQAFSICPQRKEILKGMLGADVLGFHTQQDCNNFFETVNREIESLADVEKFSITHEGHTSYIKTFPASVAFSNSLPATQVEGPSLLEDLKIKAEILAVGVDRLDYTKGFLEKFKGLEFFFDRHSEYIGKLTLLQIAPLSHSGGDRYRRFHDSVVLESERLNRKFGRDNWKPIVLIREYRSPAELKQLYRAANICLVTSLSDGMNLVAKEFVAAKDDESGVLILSKFAGASRELKDALIINPYSAEESAEAIYQAVSMPPSEQHRRMKKLRLAVKNYNIYRWAAEFLRAITSLG
jgi:trehalose 6-phosphate synthase